MTATINLVTLIYSVVIFSVGYYMFRGNLEKLKTFILCSNVSLGVLTMSCSLLNLGSSELLETIGLTALCLLIYTLVINIFLALIHSYDSEISKNNLESTRNATL